VALLGVVRPGDHTVDTVDAVYVADALLAAVGAGLVLHQRRDLGFSVERVKDGLDQLLEGVAPSEGVH
jgi:hypothetical protein